MATGYRVTAPMVVLKVRDQRGKHQVNNFYAGAIVSDDVVDEASLRRHLDRGWVEKVPKADLPVEPTVSSPQSEPAPDAGEDGGGEALPESPAETPAVSKPKQGDDKAAWVDYAVANGADRGEAEAMTKADLVELLK